MNFRSVFPLVDMKDEFTFEACKTNEQFLSEIVNIYFSSPDDRIKESTLAVYLAYRDHYPRYLSGLSKDNIAQLNSDLETATGKIVKLRRLVLSALSKVA